ncbi:MAG: hypothetical protein ACRD0X_01250 [Thermoanaerobaculia bacterium]
MRCALLGPQQAAPVLGEVARAVEARGPVAVVTAGWLERELDPADLWEELGGLEVVNLELWGRREAVRSADPAFAAASDALREDLDEVRRLYRRRLDHVVDALHEVFRETGDPELLLPERRAALAALQELDRHFTARSRELRAPAGGGERASRPEVRRQRREIADLAAPCDAIVIAGGHVVELLDCLRLFAAADLFDGRSLIAWSAGAMALTPLVVGFHDRPPQGAGNAEVLAEGLGRCPGLVALPHAKRRLDLADPYRVALLARRFAPAHCVALDEGDWLEWDGSHWRSPRGVRRLGSDGAVANLTALDEAAA